ncbi:MAG: U4/U6 small nuclear ribonucleoprotein prp4 [Sclerophora amabilis]|nr:MAG: U4/U6 small nuclear ribonucleoprotein prp4 [Sclerophora amabilis]
MGTSSGSDEGEIIESDTEKATTSLPTSNGKSVDRHSRDRLPAPNSPETSDLSHRYKDRIASREFSPRGEKRSRDDDEYLDRSRPDSRRFRVHYEDGAYNPRPRPRGPYADLDRGDRYESSLQYDDRDYYQPKRSRTRSRSPPRPSRRGDDLARDRRPNRNDRRDTVIQKRRADYGYENGRSRHSREHSVSERDIVPVPPKLSKADAETRRKDSQRNHAPSNRPAGSDKVSPKSFESTKDLKEDEHEPEPQIVDEATLIEDRRKRREAIKAKYKGQATPLLVQALQWGATSDAASPSALKLDDSKSPSTQTVTPQESPPRTPKEESGLGSPTKFEVTKDGDLANGASNVMDGADTDGPSAADYDPTMDMREDRLRNDQRQHGDDVPSGAYDETKANDHAVLLPASTVPMPEDARKKPNEEFDMFAEDDDMFAEQPSSSSPSNRAHDAGHSKAVFPPKAKELDMSMLDDWDDHEGYYKVILGELLDGRYQVQTNLGRGMFSGVVRALDSKSKKLVAIKLIRNNETMRKAGLKEIEILQQLSDADPDDKKHMVRLERIFDHKGHLCMVFENLSINLREVLKKFGRDVGINLKAVRAYAQQMFLGLSLLRKCNILHADLKPDNVLVNESRNMLKICDLGSASDASDNEITPYLVSRFYRAPEIILGMPYDFAIDTWSVGCTLYELFTGKILFTGRTNNQMLRSIMECRGKFSHKSLRRAQFAAMHFDDLLNFRSVEKDRLTNKDVLRTMNLTKPIRDLKARLMSSASGLNETELKELNLFADLLDRCLNLNPEKRCTPNEALKHPFISRAR